MKSGCTPIRACQRVRQMTPWRVFPVFTEPHDIADACEQMRLSAQAAKRVPVRWMWGPDMLAEHSAALDKMGIDGTPTEQDGRICIFAGLPVYPMQCEGIALRTVAAQ